MLTTESTNEEFLNFFKKHRDELSKRLLTLLLKKHRREIIALHNKGVEIPPKWGMLKLPEATLYILAIGIKPAKINFQLTSYGCFMIMKDLREQTPVLITNSTPHVIMYSAHAVRRYKERIGLNAETNFTEVCQHMFINGCSYPKVIGDMSKIYGSNINRRQISIITRKGTYMGYIDPKTEVIYANTFLSNNELRNDQLYLNASKSEDLIQWKTTIDAYAKGEISLDELKNKSEKFSTDIAISEGRIIKLTPEEAKLRNEENMKAISDPEYLRKTTEDNIRRFNNKIQKKGYR